MEIWKDVKGYEYFYRVSSLGNVTRKKGIQCKKERVIKMHDNGSGYKAVSLSVDSKVKKEYVHRLVAMSFLPNTENKEEVNHIDGDRSNNNLVNLEWVTRSENHFHRYTVLKQKGVNFGKTGSKNWKSKEVLKYDVYGKFIESFPAVMEAMRITGINEASIRGCIYGKQKTAGGYVWKYKLQIDKK